MKNHMLTVAVVLSLVACSDGAIRQVKNYEPEEYGNPTGQAFEATFDSPSWKSETSKKGYTVVTFTGYISKETHETVAQMYLSLYDKNPYLRGNEVALVCRMMFAPAPEETSKEQLQKCLEKEWKTGEEVQVSWSVTNDDVFLDSMLSDAWAGKNFDEINDVIYN